MALFDATPTAAPSTAAAAEVRAAENHGTASITTLQGAPRSAALEDHLTAAISVSPSILAGDTNVFVAAMPFMDELQQERNTLVRQELLEGALTERDAQRLEFLRWQLDRIDAARMGPAVNALSTVVDAHLRLADRVTRLTKVLEDAVPRAVRGPRRG